MNDWLDYQGSGSSKAYIAHYGVKGMKWDPSKLFGKKDKEELDDKKVRARIEQDDADDYAVEKTWREKRSAEMDIERYTKQVEEIEKRIKEVEKQAADIEAERKKAAVASPLKAFQESTRREKNRKLQLEDLNKQLGYAKNGLSDAKRKLSIAQVKYDKYRQQRSKHTREYDGPYVNSVRHAEKGGTSKNDWLDYQGSGSSKAYANNTISHAAVPKPIANNNAYNSLNNKLDQFYKSTQDLINLARNLRTSYESMISAARNTKKNVTLAEGKYKMWETAYNKIDSDIDAANISDMQKTALRNKLERISDGAGEISKINTGGEIDMNMDTFNNIISNIQNAMRR